MTTTPSQPPVLPVPAPARPGRWKTWLLALLIFGGGLAVGTGLTIIIAVRTLQNAAQHPEEAPARITLRLSRRLNLTPEQTAQVRAIVIARQRALGRMRRQMQPQIDSQLVQLESQINEILTPSQRRTWQTMVVNLRKNWFPPAPASDSDSE